MAITSVGAFRCFLNMKGPITVLTTTRNATILPATTDPGHPATARREARLKAGSGFDRMNLRTITRNKGEHRWLHPVRLKKAPALAAAADPERRKPRVVVAEEVVAAAAGGLAPPARQPSLCGPASFPARLSPH